MDDSLRAGVAICNADAYRAAHGVWKSKWLSLERDADDEWFLHGLIQFTVTVHHARDGNDSGVVGLARDVREYLNGPVDDYRGVDPAGVRGPLTCLEADPGVATGPLALRLDDRVVTYDDPDFGVVAVVAKMLAEELDGYNESVAVDTVGYTHEGVADGEQTQFTAMVFNFVWNETQRELVFQRLSGYVRRRRRREDDVSGPLD